MEASTVRGETLKILERLRSHLLRKVGTTQTRRATGGARQLSETRFSAFEPLYVRPSNEEFLLNSLEEASNIFALVGPPGAGKSTLIAKFIETRLEGAHGQSNGYGHVTIDFGETEVLTALGLKPTPRDGMIDGKALQQEMIHMLREQIRADYILSGPNLAEFHGWIRDWLACYRDDDRPRAHPMISEGVKAREDINKIMRESEPPLDPYDDTEYATFVQTSKDIRLVDKLVAVDRSLMSRHLIQFLLDRRGIRKFFIIFDNVDAIENSYQDEYVGILDSIWNGTDHKAAGIITIRQENIRDAAPYSPIAGRAFLRAEAIAPMTGDKHVIEFASTNLQPAQDGGQAVSRDAEEGDGPVPAEVDVPDVERHLPSQVIMKRVQIALREIRLEAGAMTLAACDVVAILTQRTLNTYLEQQMFAACNANIREFVSWYWAFLYHSADRYFDQLVEVKHGHVTALPCSTDTLASIFYRFLRNPGYSASGEKSPFPRHDLPYMIDRMGRTNCFVPHLILAYLLNARRDAARRQRHYHYTLVGELREALRKIGINESRADINAALMDLFWDGDGRGHAIEVRIPGLVRPRPGRPIPDDAEIWLTARGEFFVTTYPYKFHSILNGIEFRTGRSSPVDVWALPSEVQTSLVVTFLRELVNAHMFGIRDVYEGHFTVAGIGPWEETYLETFGIPVKSKFDGTFQTYQVHRAISHVRRYVYESKMDERWIAHLNHLRREFDRARERVRNNQPLMKISSGVHADLPLDYKVVATKRRGL